MTQRLYYTDTYLRKFEATVEAVTPRGDAIEVTLDRTAFYPTSGGQPFDTGTLGSYSVVDVVDRDDGVIAHVLKPAATLDIPEPGTAIAGVIDWTRRFDHMQQHTGQHVLSAAFDRLLGAATVSFHLGAEASTIDLARVVTPKEIAAAEDEANRVVWEDRPVHIRFADAAETAALKLRKPSAREGTLRLIDVEEFDLSACGGTHVARTGSIGTIAVASSERFKGGSRLEFLCGRRALARFRALRDVVAECVRLSSVQPAELSATFERLQSDAREQKRAITAFQNEVATYRADAFAAAAEEVALASGATVRLVARAIDADAALLKSLASTIAERKSFMAVFVSLSQPSLVVVARGSDVRMSARSIFSSLISQFGGRGGGRDELAQGTLNATSDAIISAARMSIMAEHTPNP